MFSREAVLEDLSTLRESLIDAHYNVYAYTTEQTFDSAYHSVENDILKDSLSFLEATNHFQRLISVIKNGHTEIPFPGQSYGEYAEAGGTLFPLEIALEDDKALIRKNWSDDQSIPIGSELASINGISISEILSGIYPQVSAERPYFRNAKIELYSLPRYYWQVYGRQDDFEVEIRSGDTVRKHPLKAVSVVEGFEMKSTFLLASAMQLKFMGTTAYMNPGGFGGDEEKYRRFIDSSFAQIKQKKSTDLILDLRNNSGGNDSFSDYMVSYIADKPFKWNSKFTLKTSRFLKEHVRQNNDTTSAYWKEVLSRKDGEVYEYAYDPYQPQPKDKRFTGNVYVLVNRHSHSQSAVTASQIQDYGFGTIVGEETGDYPSLYASVFSYQLPNTGIAVQVSKGYIVRVNGSTAEQGVMPDIFIRDHLLDENDEILNGLLEKINASN